MLILFMIVYISKKLQNYSFDLIIFFIILIQLVTVQISVSSKIVDNIPIVLNMFLGENHMEKQLHLFLSIFYLGFLVGIFFFIIIIQFIQIQIQIHYLENFILFLLSTIL